MALPRGRSSLNELLHLAPSCQSRSNGTNLPMRAFYNTKFRVSLAGRSRRPMLCIRFGCVKRTSERRLFATHGRGNSDALLETDGELDRTLQETLEPIRKNPMPSETEAQHSLQTLEQLCTSVAWNPAQGHRAGPRSSSASGLLSLEGESKAASTMSDPDAMANLRRLALRKIVRTARTIVTDSKVFITPESLDTYMNILRISRSSELVLEALNLYSTKLIPMKGSNPVTYKSPNPKAASQAIQYKTANTALTTAMEARDLALCLDITKATACQPSFQKAKFIRKALFPLSGLALSPLAAYTLATQLSQYQDTMSTGMATGVITAGIVTYITCTSMLGLVAVTTANDQMDRVTWRVGTPLRFRWIKEEERAMLDRVAQAWGLKERSRRGEEDSAEWEALREWIALRSMVLDNPALMDGME